jgi:hypothetical protein
MNLWRTRSTESAAAPMPRWTTAELENARSEPARVIAAAIIKRALCALVLVVTAPLWMLAMLALAVGLIVWGLGEELLED